MSNAERWTYILKQMSPHAKPEIISMIADHADEQFARWSITSVRRQATILAHAYVETKAFTRLDEDLNYSAQRLCQVWLKRFPTLASAKPFEHNPRALANKVYNGRMGNRLNTDDGWENRGKGLWQATGHDNCAEIGKKLNVSADTASAWLIDPNHALECACALFWILKVAPAADSGDVTKQTLRINGGTNGLSERKVAYAKAMRLLTASVAAHHVAAMTDPHVDDEIPEVTAKELRAAGSRTIRGADVVQESIGGGVVSAVTAAVARPQDTINQVFDTADQIGGAIDGVKAHASLFQVVTDHWSTILFAVAVLTFLYFAYRAWRGASLVKLARVDDANTGVNLSR